MDKQLKQSSLFSKCILLSACIIFAALPVYSATQDEVPHIRINSDTFDIPLEQFSELLIDESGVMTLEDVMKSDEFKLRDVGRVRSFNEADVYWYRYRVSNELNDDMVMILKTHARNVTNATLYQLDLSYPEGVSQIVAEQSFGDWQNFHDRTIRSRNYALALSVPAHADQIFYLKWQDKGQDVYEMQLVDIARFFSGEMVLQAYNFLTLGFAVAVLIYNISIFRRTKDSIYLGYSIYVVSFVLFLETQNGSMAALWPPIFGAYNLALFAFTSAYLVIFALLRFTKHILLLDEREPERAYWFRLLQYLSLLLFVICFFLPFQVAEFSVYFSSIAAVFICMHEAFRIRKKYSDLFAKTYIASFIPLGFSVLMLTSIYIFELPSFPFMNEVIRITFCLNLMILSNSLADQIDVMTKKQQRYEASLVAARASQAVKNEFFGKMSHEIRTPLNGVIGASQLLQSSHLDNEQRKYVDILKASSNALMHLVNNIVDFSKVEAGKMRIEEENFDLQALLLELEKVFMVRILESGVPLLFEVEKDLPRYLFGDVNRIRQILINLLGNAYKFTEQGVIRIRVSRFVRNENHIHRDFFRFEVIDTGIGIPPMQVDSIFEDFTQVYSREARDHRGAGLGLAICRELSHLLKGEIRLDSELGKGSTFIVELPLKEGLVEHEDISKDFSLQKNEILSSKSILIVDECSYCSFQLSQACQAWGMKVGSEANLSDALDSVRRSSEVGVNLDLLVVNMKCLETQTGGNHFIEALMRHNASKNVVVLVLSNRSQALPKLRAQLDNGRGYVFQHLALVSMYEEVLQAALEGDVGFFFDNSLLINESLEELLKKDLLVRSS